MSGTLADSTSSGRSSWKSSARTRGDPARVASFKVSEALGEEGSEGKGLRRKHSLQGVASTNAHPFQKATETRCHTNDGCVSVFGAHVPELVESSEGRRSVQSPTFLLESRKRWTDAAAEAAVGCRAQNPGRLLRIE